MADQVIGRLVYEVTQIGLAQLKRELEDLTKKPLKITPEVTSEGKRALSEIDDEMRRLRNRVTGLRNEFAASGGDINRYTQNLKAAQREALELAKSHDRSSQAFVHLTGTAASAQRGIVSALRAQAMAVTPLQEQIARLQNQVHGLRNQYIATGGPADQFAARMRRVRDEALRAAQGLATTSKEFRQLQTVAAQAERAAVQAMGGMSRLGLASQVRAGMSGFFGPGGVGRVMASGIGIMPGIVGQTAYFTSIFARDLGRLNAVTATATAGTLALAGAMAAGTVQAARLQQQQRLLEAITRESAGAYNELTRGILDLSTKVPVTTRALFEAAEEAAKLGVDGAQNILAFTEAIQGLAFVTRGDVGTLASEVAKFMNELGIGPTSANYLDELDGVANALAAVHVWSAATAEETISLSRYFAAIAAQVGLTAPQIISLSGSLAALGGQAQSSGTNLSKFFLDMARAADQGGARLQGMAEIAGMTTREFRDLVRSDIVEAFLRIARGLNEAHGSAGDFARAMDMIGAENMRLIRVLGQASVGQETFLTILERVNEAQREKNYLDNVLADATNNLIDQTRLLFQTLSAVLAIMGEPVVEQLTERVKSLRESVDELYRRFNSLNDEQLRAIAIAGELVLGVVGMTVAFAALNSIVGIVMSGFRTLISIGSFVFGPTILWIAGITTAVVLLRRGWEENWFGMRDAATNAMEAVRAKWESVKTFFVGRDVAIPPAGPGLQGEWSTARVGGLAGFALPSLTIPDWSATIDTAREEASRAWQRVRRFFGFEDEEPPTLPEIESPNWEEDIDASRLGAERAWARVKAFFTLENLERPTLPELDIPNWAEVVESSRLAVEERWNEFVDTDRAFPGWPDIPPFEWPEPEPFSWPPIEPFKWPDIPDFDWSVFAPPDDVEMRIGAVQRALDDLSDSINSLPLPRWDDIFPPDTVSEEVVDKISEAITQGVQASMESPKGQVALNVGEIVGDVMAGDKTLGEAIKDLIQGSITASLLTIGISLLPVSGAWKLTMIGVSFGLQLAAEQGITIENASEWIQNAKKSILDLLSGLWEGEDEAIKPDVDWSGATFGVDDAIELQRSLGARIKEIASDFRFDEAYSEGSGEIGFAVGRALSAVILGGITWALTDGLLLLSASATLLMDIGVAGATLGYEFARAFVAPFVSGFMEGLMDIPVMIAQGWMETFRETLVRTGISMGMSQDQAETMARRFAPDLIYKPDPNEPNLFEQITKPFSNLPPEVQSIYESMGRATTPDALEAFALQRSQEMPASAQIEAIREQQRREMEAFTRTLLQGTALPELTIAESATNQIVSSIPRLRDAQAELQAIASRYVELTTDAGLQDVIEFLALIVSESGLTAQTLKDSMENPARMTARRMEEVADKVSDVNDRLEGSIVLWNELRAVTESAAQAAALYKLPGLVDRVGFDSTVRAAELFPGLAGTDMANLSPFEIQRRYNDILKVIGGYYHGGIIPGTSGPDQFLAMVAPGEAIVPAKEVQGGWPAVLSWFRRMGVPGFQTGKPPAFGADMQSALDYANVVVAEARASSFSDEMRQMFADSIQLLGQMFERGGKAIFGEEFYNTAKDFINDLMGAFSILTGGAPGETTAKLVVPEGAEQKPPTEEVKSAWERFLEWLKEQWENTLAGTVSQKLKDINAVLGGLFDVARSSLQVVNEERERRTTFDLGTFASGLGSMLMGGAVSFIFDSIAASSKAAQAAAVATVELQRRLAQVEQLGTTPDVLSIGEQLANVTNLEANKQALRDRLREQARIQADIFEAENPTKFLGIPTDRFGMNAEARAAFIASRKADLEDLNREITRLENAINSTSPRELARTLGISADRFASAIQSAFSAATFEDAKDGLGNIVEGFKTRLSSAVNDIIRNALINQFIGDVIAKPITDLADKVFEDITAGAEPDMDAVQRTIEDIQDRAQPFYEMLERLGLAGNTASEALNRTTESLINVPSVFKRALRQFQASEGIPGLASGGYVPATPGGRIVRLGEGGEGEWVIPDSKMGGRTVLVHVDMRESTFVGDADFERRVKRIVANAFEEAASVQYG